MKSRFFDTIKNIILGNTANKSNPELSELSELADEQLTVEQKNELFKASTERINAIENRFRPSPLRDNYRAKIDHKEAAEKAEIKATKGKGNAEYTKTAE